MYIKDMAEFSLASNATTFAWVQRCGRWHSFANVKRQYCTCKDKGQTHTMISANAHHLPMSKVDMMSTTPRTSTRRSSSRLGRIRPLPLLRGRLAELNLIPPTLTAPGWMGSGESTSDEYVDVSGIHPRYLNVLYGFGALTALGMSSSILSCSSLESSSAFGVSRSWSTSTSKKVRFSIVPVVQGLCLLGLRCLVWRKPALRVSS